MKKLIIASTSTVYGSEYLEYLLPTVKYFFARVNTILFIPYARASGKTYEEYTKLASKALNTIGLEVKGIHEFENPKEAIKNAEAIFIGGGNTFELINQLYKNDLIIVLKEAIENGIPYLGTSAGSNICGVDIKTTNDMPIIYPSSFNALNIFNFNTNVHYIDADPASTHMGETRETRINEFHVFNDTPVLGLREGSWLEIINDRIVLRGNLAAKWFYKDKSPIMIEPNSIIT